jgi:hypothetical protein
VIDDNLAREVAPPPDDNCLVHFGPLTAARNKRSRIGKRLPDYCYYQNIWTQNPRHVYTQNHSGKKTG